MNLPIIRTDVKFSLQFLDGNVIELPSSLLPLGVKNDDFVEVEAISSIVDATVIHVEPLSWEDWELLEASAEFLEGGALLQQISVVFPEQKIPLCW